MDKESLKNHLKHLQDKHKDLKLDLMEADMNGDEITAQKIKKEKLALKDEMETLKKKIGDM